VRKPQADLFAIVSVNPGRLTILGQSVPAAFRGGHAPTDAEEQLGAQSALVGQGITVYVTAVRRAQCHGQPLAQNALAIIQGSCISMHGGSRRDLTHLPRVAPSGSEVPMIGPAARSTLGSLCRA
jgi:hypothetical protein